MHVGGLAMENEVKGTLSIGQLVSTRSKHGGYSLIVVTLQHFFGILTLLVLIIAGFRMLACSVLQTMQKKSRSSCCEDSNRVVKASALKSTPTLPRGAVIKPHFLDTLSLNFLPLWLLGRSIRSCQHKLSTLL